MTAETVYQSETAIVPDGPGRWRGHVTAAWNIGDNPNGGYLLVPVLRAMREVAGQPDPLSVTVHYLRPGTPDLDSTVTAELVRGGRSLSTVRGALAQDGRDRLLVLAVFGDLASGPPEPHLDAARPEIPPPGDCIERVELAVGPRLGLLSRLDIRVHPDDAHPPTGRGVVRGWIRFRDGAPVDALALPLFADAYPPAVYGAVGPVGWVPTVELTVHVRRRPAPGWVCGALVCDDLAGGRMIESGTLWDEAGAVVARSRQLGLLLPREEGPAPGLRPPATR